MTICIAACLFLLRTGSLSVNRDVGSVAPTTGAAWPNRLTHANAKSSTTAKIFFMALYSDNPGHAVKWDGSYRCSHHGPSFTQDGSAFQGDCSVSPFFSVFWSASQQ